jgi:phosphoribosylaminoimidazole-succinocarboxamide synthase
VLNGLSAFWFQRFEFVRNHVVSLDPAAFSPALRPYAEELRGRAMVVFKAKPLPVECVVRGYLAGSGWKEYQASGTVCGEALPPGLEQASPLPRTLFTPSTKAVSGHDENIPFTECERILGPALAGKVRERSIALYEAGRAHAAERGIIVADTKFEFGLLGDELILIDECLTPDSSRFWAAEGYRLGISPPSFDKQFVRDYLETLTWDKTPPAPELPEEVVERTSEKYREAFAQLTGSKLVANLGTPLS